VTEQFIPAWVDIAELARGRTTMSESDAGLEDVIRARDYWLELYFKRERELQSAEAEKAEIKIAKLDYKLSDNQIIVITVPGMISSEMAKRLKEAVEKHLQGAKVIIFGDGIEMEIR
jgi:hypothetical protein